MDILLSTDSIIGLLSSWPSPGKVVTGPPCPDPVESSIEDRQRSLQGSSRKASRIASFTPRHFRAFPQNQPLVDLQLDPEVPGRRAPLP